MRATRLLALVLALAPTAFGCGDDIKFPDPDLPDPALNGVFPAKGFTDRTLRVEISGDGTEFAAAPMVSFGPGITVGEVELSSPSTLFATVTIAGDAALGKRDVVVGDTELRLTAAFEVLNPIEVLTTGNNLQGGIDQILVLNHDPEHPFFGDLDITAGTGTTIIVQQQTEFTALALAFFDTDAASGNIVVADTLVDTVTSRGNQLLVTPRAAIAMQPPVKGTGFTASGTLNGDSTALFSFTTQSALARGQVFADDFFDNPIVVWLQNGKWANARGFSFDDLVPTTENGTLPLVVLNLDPDGFLDLAPAGVAFDIDIDDDFHDLPGVTNINEVEDNDPITSTGTAQLINSEFSLYRGTLADFFDFDILTVTLTDSQSIRVTTTTGSLGIADTEIIIVDDQLNTIIDTDDNQFFFEDGETGPLPAGTYHIALTCSFFANPDPINDPYEAAITIIDNAL